jgi:hypothetical protein
MEKKFICPLPSKWNQIYQILLEAWELNQQGMHPPPKPLILAGWNYTNDVEKRMGWNCTISWAKNMGITHLVPELTPEQCYFVEELSTYSIGPMGGPIYLAWDFTPKTKPSADSIEAALVKLNYGWNDIAGVQMATSPNPFDSQEKKIADC